MTRLSKTKRELRRVLTPAARAVRQHLLPPLFPYRGHAFPQALRDVRVVGLLSSSSGLGKSARLCIEALRDAGYAVTGADVADLFDSADGLAPPMTETRRAPPQVSIYHLNPPMLLPGIMRSNPIAFWRSYAIGYWAWELETLPAEWIGAIRFMDAIMVPSAFCKTAIERHTTKPVLVVPHPVTLDPSPLCQRPEQPDGRPFRVVSIFNFGSSFERKNPVAVVRAFRRAFGSGQPAELILKVSDGSRYADDKARIEAEIGRSSNIRLIDEVWDAARLSHLLASADAYLSMHRSEGFGLTLAEAIVEGVPVVATNWSGNMDFCRPDLCFPVDYALVPLQDRHASFATVGKARWAEPSIEHAAAQLRRVRDHREAARRAAAELRDHLRAHLRGSTYARALSGLAEGAVRRATAALVDPAPIARGNR